MRNPVLLLLERLRTINKEIRHGKTPLYVYKTYKLPYKDHDEMGFISATINSLLRTMSKTFVELQRSQRDTSEYLKAVYAGGLVSIGDTLGNITYVNEKFCTLTGYYEEELLGKPHSILRDKTTASRVYKKLWETIESGEIYSGVLKNIKKDGTTFYANTTIVPIKDEENRIVKYIAFRDDITELINSKIELRQTLLTDPLTNLGNRFKMLSEIDEDSYLAIVDIHYFREINDFYGYKIGDIVLQDLAKRLNAFFTPKDMDVYHLNGDEFGIVSHGRKLSENVFFDTLKEFLEASKLQELYIEQDLIITIRLTCGISYASDNIISHADIAHKHAKKTNKDIAQYTDQINTDEEYKRNLQWSHELKCAIDENRIQAYFQPIVNAKNSKIEKYETLMRLIKKDGEVVTPIHFLNIAKKTRIYKELTKIMAHQAFEKFSGTTYCFSINLSVEDILSGDIESWFFDLALEKDIAKQLVIEIVESDGIESFEAINEFIQKAKEHGMRIAIDDFGTGYSNFEYLIKLNADFLKIDGSLIKEIDKDTKIYSVVETIVAFAKKNDIQVIGEFVATKEIYDKLCLLGIDYGQGFYLGYPASELQ
jgi:PAS domain S-box-containing protein